MGHSDEHTGRGHRKLGDLQGKMGCLITLDCAENLKLGRMGGQVGGDIRDLLLDNLDT